MKFPFAGSISLGVCLAALFGLPACRKAPSTAPATPLTEEASAPSGETSPAEEAPEKTVREEKAPAQPAAPAPAAKAWKPRPKYTGEMIDLGRDITLIIPDPRNPAPGGPAASPFANRLSMLLKRAMGVEPKILPASQDPGTGSRIYVGHGEHLTGKITPPTEPEGILLKEQDGAVYLIGEVAAPGTINNKAPLDRGTMFAVETFAEDILGYRFVMSSLDKAPAEKGTFELGTVIPELTSLKVPKGLDFKDAPAFQHRVMSSRPRNIMGLREGSAHQFYCNHSYDMGWWSSRFGKSDPDMFIPRNAKKGGGTDQAVEAMQSQPNLSWLDYTHPKVLQVRLEELEKEIKGGRGSGFYYRPNNRYIIEETPDSAAPSVQYNERSRALFDPKHHSWGNFSNIWFDYLRRMSPEVERRFPGMRISTLAYMRHYGVPTFDIPDNIDVMLTMMRTSMGNKEPEVFNSNLADVRKWSEKLGNDRNRLFLWEYGCWPAFWVSTPTLCPNAMQKWLKAVRPHVAGVFFEMYDPREYYFLMRRLWMRMLWNPELDVNAEIDDICHHFFGPSGETMAEFYKLLIERYEMPWTKPKLTWGQYYLSNDLYFGQSFTPEVTDRLAALLEKAHREAGLPGGFQGGVSSGSAVHVHNPDQTAVPMSFSIHAKEDSLAVPTVVWEGGRFQYQARLMPGERLDISADGSAKVVSTNGTGREVKLVQEGELPILAANSSQLIRFRKSGGDQKKGFEVSVRFGPNTAAAPADSGIYGRRLRWMARAHRVISSEKSWGPDIADRSKKNTNYGFLAHARWYHQSKGLVPSYKEPDDENFVLPEVAKAAELAKLAQQAVKRANSLNGPENAPQRAKEIETATAAFNEAMSLYPEWNIDNLDPKNPWSTVNARIARANLFSATGQPSQALAELNAALEATGKNRDAKSYVEMLAGDTCRAQGDLKKAEEWYHKAQRSGLYGDRKTQVPQRLKEVQEELAKREAAPAEPAAPPSQ